MKLIILTSLLDSSFSDATGIEEMTSPSKGEKMQRNSSSPEESVLLYLFDIIKSCDPPAVKLAGLYVMKELLNRTVAPVLVDFCSKRGLPSILMDVLTKEFDQFDEHNNILLYTLSAEVLWIITYVPLQKYEMFSNNSFIHHLVDFLNVKSKFYQFSPRFVQTLDIFQNKYFVQQKIQAVVATPEVLEDLKYYSGGVVQNCEISKVFMFNPNLSSPESETITTHLSEILVKEGLAWPLCVQNENGCAAASESTLMKLPLALSTDKLLSSNGTICEDFLEVMDVYMLHTIGGNYFWGLLGENSHELVSSLSHLLEQLLPMVTHVAPKVGETVIITLDTDVKMHRIIRGRVLDLCDKTVKVLAIDCGFITTVDTCQIFGLDIFPEVSSFPPQAQVCCFSGMQAPPADEITVELVLAILVNMTKTSVKTGIMLLEAGGIRHLVSLLRCGRPAILVQVGCLISSLASNSSLHRQEDLSIFIKPLLDLLQGSKLKKHLTNKVVVSCLSALKNIIVFSQAMRDNFLKYEGQLVVLKLMWMFKYVAAVVHNCAILLNICYPGLRPTVSSKEIESLASLQLSDSSAERDVQLTTKPCTRADAHDREVSKFSEEEVELLTQPLMQHPAEDLSSCDEEEESSYSSQRDGKDKETGNQMLSAGLEGRIMPVDGGSLVGKSKKFIELESYLPLKDDLTHHIIESQHVRHISSSMVANIVCGMLNSGHGGSIYFGLSKDGYVQGVRLNRDDRDRLRLGVDELMDNTFVTPILPTQVDVIYTPVRQTLCSGHLVPYVNLFVVADMLSLKSNLCAEIIIKPNKDTVYITSSGKCFYRFGPNTTELTVQEVRQFVVLEEEEKYKDEILQLRHELQTLQDGRM